MARRLLSALRPPPARALFPAALAALVAAVAGNGQSFAQVRTLVMPVRLTEESLPAEEMPPTATATPAPTVAPTAVSTPSPAGAPSVAPTPALTPTPTPAVTPKTSSPAVQATPGATAAASPAAQPQASPAPPAETETTGAAPLEVGAVEPVLRASDSSLEAVIRAATSPAAAASLRVVDQARQKILANRPDGAIELLTYALSIDPANSYAYFYLGRSWLVKKNYPQAITFLKRAEIGLGSDALWLSETLAFEGLTYEEYGNPAAAEEAYQDALKAEPGNLMARAGYTRLAAEPPAPAPEAAAPSAAASASEAVAPPAQPPPPPAPSMEPPAPAPESEEPPAAGSLPAPGVQPSSPPGD